jgi:PPP family 3-phenylpropionic acid transporter
MNEGHPLDYSLTRSFGSFTFAVTAVGFGALLDWQGTWVRTPAYLLLMAALIGTALSTPAPHHAEHPAGTTRPASPFRQLAQNRAYMVFLVSVVLIGVGYGSLFPFYPVLLAQHGGTNAHLGLGLFLMALCEMPAMFFYSRITARFDKGRRLLALSILFFAVKNAAIALSPDLNWAIGLQMLQALSFGLYLPAAVHYMRAIVDPKASGTAQMVHAAASSGLGATIGSFVGGVLAGPLGVAGMILAMSGACFLGYLIFALSQTTAMQKWMGVVYFDNQNNSVPDTKSLDP